MNTTLRANIDTLAARARKDGRAAPLSERIADRITRFTGSMTFVALHVIAYASWIIVNLGLTPLPRFDPSFVLLAMEASVEAIFLSTFVLISQNRMAAAAAHRADLDLHISLLTEHELTKLATLVARIAEHVGVADDDPEFHEITNDVQPETVLDAIEASGSPSGD